MAEKMALLLSVAFLLGSCGGACIQPTDKNEKCRSWAANGECTKNAAYMSKNCAESCGNCPVASDDVKSCRNLLQQGMCRRHESKRLCSLTCSACGECFDANADCASWKARGECLRNPKWMNVNCACSCGKCTGAAETGNSKMPAAVTEKPSLSRPDLNFTVNEAVCGLRLRMHVVGGNASGLGDWPWQVGLVKRADPKRSVICGGSILNKKFVLTAAHCFRGEDGLKPNDYQLRIGEVDLSKKEDEEKLLDIASIQVHQLYDRSTYDNDVALITVKTLMAYNKAVRSVCLPSLGKEFALSTRCHVTGWGRTHEDGFGAQILQEAQVPLVDKTTCRNIYKEIYETVTDNQLCAGYAEGKIDACQGDSGGPLVCVDGGRYYQAGIVSWGRGCARARRYGVYTEVSRYRDWIERTIQAS